MAFEIGSQTKVLYAAETVFGVTDATPQMIALPKTSITLDLSKEILPDPTITDDRMQSPDRHGNYIVGGDLVASLRHGQFDDLIQAACGGTWGTPSANVLRNGVTKRSFTVEQQFSGIAKNRVFKGVRLNTFGLTIEPGSIVTATYGFLGASMVTSPTVLDASPTAVQNKRSMSHVGGSITVDAGAVTCTAASLTIDNGLEAQYAIGDAGAQDVTWADVTVTGSLTFYVDTNFLTLYDLFVNEVPCAIAMQVSDGTNTITINIPVAQFNTAGITVPGPGVLFMTMDFKAGRDPANYVVQVTRSV